MAAQTLTTELVADILVVTIDKPGEPVNTLGPALVGEFEGVFLRVDEDTLIIRGERHSDVEDEQEGFYRSERSYGKFYRRLPIPEGVNIKDAEATFQNGVLEVKMKTSKREQQKSRRLEITDASAPKAHRKAAGA